MHPVAGQALGEPDSPLNAESLCHVEREQRAQYVNGRQHRKYPKQVPEGILVEALQGTVEPVVPE
ncbi:hypothetical protein D3C80_2093790 [compost metagenome]